MLDLFPFNLLFVLLLLLLLQLRNFDVKGLDRGKDIILGKQGCDFSTMISPSPGFFRAHPNCIMREL